MAALTGRLGTRAALPAVAALLSLLALGLPWSVSTQTYVPGWSTFPVCTMNFETGEMYCPPGTTQPGMTFGVPAQAGSQSVVRVFLVAALLVLLISAGSRLGSRWAAGLLAAGMLLAGLGMQAGQLAALAAIALLAVHGWGRRGTPSTDTSRTDPEVTDTSGSATAGTDSGAAAPA